MLAGADAVKVKNLLTGEESIKDYRDFTLFLKKGSGQTTASQPAATTKGYGKNFKFEIGDKVIYKGNNENAIIKAKEFFGGVYFYSIVYDTGIRQDDIREVDLEFAQKTTTQPIDVQQKEGVIKAPMPTKTPIKEQIAERKKYDLVDFKPLLENWVNSNFTNSTLLTKKDIVKETITNYILDVEAVDGNQTIQFNKETEILDNIDNYLN
jgi:hypothetical protein